MDGLKDVTFYALRSPSGEPVENIDFCTTCYHSYLRPFGPDFERNFIQKTDLAPGTIRLCDLCIGLARALGYIRKLMKAGITGSFTIFAEHVTTHARIPMCPTSKAVMDNRKWYGTNDFLICEECHWDVVRPSSFPYPVSFRCFFFFLARNASRLFDSWLHWSRFRCERLERMRDARCGHPKCVLCGMRRACRRTMI